MVHEHSRGRAGHYNRTMGERALKLVVVLLCIVNAAVWLLYTESLFMAILWSGTALGFVVWIADDVRRRW